MIGIFHFKNVGPNSFMILQGSYDWYCSRAEQTLVRPHQFPLLHYRVLPPGQTTQERFSVRPLTADFHDDHEGECDWFSELTYKWKILRGSSNTVTRSMNVSAWRTCVIIHRMAGGGGLACDGTIVE